MKEIKIVYMHLRNFKGVRELEVVANGSTLSIYGDNAAGKTTVFDAFTWSLFGKNAQDQQKFQLKTLDAEGNEIHNLEHEVELHLLVDGQLVKLRRLLKESQKTKNGTNEVSYTDTMKYHIDDVPVKTLKAYDEFIASLVDEKQFKLLTSPIYFNEVLKWEERRKILLEVCGDVTDAEVIAANLVLEKLPEMLNGKTSEQRKAQVSEQKKAILENVRSIPNRIDELSRQIPESAVDVSKDRAESERINNEVDALRAQKITVSSGAAVSNKQAEITTLNSELSSYMQTFNANSSNLVTKLQVQLQEKQANISIAQSKIKQVQSEIESKDYVIGQSRQLHTEATELRQRLLAEYKPLDETIYQHPQSDDTCPSCAQQLPKEQVDAAKSKAEEAFNLQKSTKLAEIKKKGIAQAGRINEMAQKISVLQHERSQLVEQFQTAEGELTPHQKVLEKTQQQLETTKASAPDITQDPHYQTLLTQRQALMSDLQQLQQYAMTVVTDIDTQIMQLQSEKRVIDTQIALVANIENIKKRIEQLEDEQHVYQTQLEALEHVEYLINEFERCKVRMLDERINSKFRYANFKLFEDQKNGGLKSTCQTTYDGVPYNDLNNAMTINIGLDICNTLQAHYGVIAPIFIDNRESITKLMETDAQIISLIVSEPDKKLRVETAGIAEVIEMPTNQLEIDLEVI